MIIALAGRRIDEPGSTPRFPLEHVERVRERVRALLERERAQGVVSAAACGADLIALSEAAGLGLRRHIVLPTEPASFREHSVVDRPGDWGRSYDELIQQARADGDLVVTGHGHGDEAYRAANLAILDEATQVARDAHEPLVACLVWDQCPRGEGDVTEHFGNSARDRGLKVLEVSTL